MDETGAYQVEKLDVGDIWYFPKGSAHTVQGLSDENEYLLVFDDGNFDAVGTTFNIDDWLSHTPVSVLAKNFGVPESTFGTIPSPNPYIVNSTVNTQPITDWHLKLTGNSSYVYHTFQHPSLPVPGGGGEFRIIDSRNFPISTTIAATVVTLKPKGLRELHWHPNVSRNAINLACIKANS